jgi:hypothetical protein
MEAALKQAPPEAKQRPSVIGYIDAIAGDRIFGWAWDSKRPAARIAIRFEAKGEVVAAVIADAPRQDLKDNHVGDGAHAFEAMLPGDVSSDEVKVLAVCPETGTTVELAPRPAVVPTEVGNTEDLRPVVQMLCQSHHVVHRHLRSFSASLDEIRRDVAAMRDPKETPKPAPTPTAAPAEVPTPPRLQALEVAVLRIDGMVREQAGSIETLLQRPADRISRILAILAVLIATGAVAALLLR